MLLLPFVASVVSFVDSDVDLDWEHPATTIVIGGLHSPAKNRFRSFFHKWLLSSHIEECFHDHFHSLYHNLWASKQISAKSNHINEQSELKKHFSLTIVRVLASIDYCNFSKSACKVATFFFCRFFAIRFSTDVELDFWFCTTWANRVIQDPSSKMYFNTLEVGSPISEMTPVRIFLFIYCKSCWSGARKRRETMIEPSHGMHGP